MNAVAEPRLAVTVALLGPNDAAREQLRNALRALGADLVFEGELSEAPGLSAMAEPPAVLIVNLEPGVEDELDSIQDLLDHPETSVVFNEGEVSSQLTGWDLARWARHLASKVLGIRDTLPPAPSGAARLPVLDLVPEPGRPASPAQQQDHLEFDTFADEVFERQDHVPSSPRLDQVNEETASSIADTGLDFDFSPVASVSAADAESLDSESQARAAETDDLDKIDLSTVFEQGFDQLTPEDLLARLQMAMGLDPVVLPEDRTLSSGQVEDRPAVAEPESRVDPRGATENDADERPADSISALPDVEVEQSIEAGPSTLEHRSFEVEAGESEFLMAAGDPPQDHTGATVGEPDEAPVLAEASANAGHGFDPVSAEFDFDLAGDEDEPTPGQDSAGRESEALDFDFNFELESSAADSLEDLDESSLDVGGLSIEGLQLESPDTDRDPPGFSAQDAALGGTISLESEADDDEIERLSAALDAQAALTPEIAHEEFDFSRPKSEDVSADFSIESPRPPEAPSAPAAKGGGFGELSLTPMDDSFIDPGVMAPLAEPPRSTFDFSTLSLSLEPIAEPETDSLASKDPNIATVASMRDGTWLRDIGEELPVAHEPEPEPEELVADSPVESYTSTVQVAPMPVVAPALTQGVSRVIVLCASIGGPDAVRSFLAGIPEGFPAVFLVVQHLESGYFERLAQQLQKACKLSVTVPVAGRPVRDGEVLVVTSDNRLRVSVDGEVQLDEVPDGSRYHPCIDDVLRDVSLEFGANATALIFSGMAADAIEGAVELTQRGGEVWVQDPESCVVSSMVDGARARGVVEFVGSPRELAERCVRRFGA